DVCSSDLLFSSLSISFIRIFLSVFQHIAHHPWQQIQYPQHILPLLHMGTISWWQYAQRIHDPEVHAPVKMFYSQHPQSVPGSYNTLSSLDRKSTRLNS